MKKLLLLLFSIVITITFGQNVSIPDVNFKAYLVGDTAINTNGDSEIQIAEATAFTGSIYCGSNSISDLTGIEYFTNLTYLSCSNNQLTSLDVSNNTALTVLSCGGNHLTSLDVSNKTALTKLYCQGNQLTSLDVSNNTALEELFCSVNQLTSLDVSSNTALIELSCYENQLTSLDVSNNTALTQLRCIINQLTSLDVSSNTALTQLLCSDNQLTSLEVSNNTALTQLSCGGNHLTSLDVSNNTALTFLSCPENQLTSIDVSNNIALTWLWCGDNQLTSLDIRNGNNSSFNIFNSLNNPYLNCILVDDAAWSTTNWTNIDTASTFVNNQAECNALSIESFELNNNFTIYPNPTVSNLQVSFNGQIDKVEVYSVLGKKVIETKSLIIPTVRLSQGIYFVKLYAKGKQGFKRFVKL